MSNLQDEKFFTPHADVGWLSWNEWSPEQDFCRFVGMLQRMLQPEVTLETGVGIGRLTSHLDMTIGSYLGFESNPDFRQYPADPSQPRPNADQMEIADFVILDSDPPFRFVELDLWAKYGKSGSTCIIHDCGNGHPEQSFHAEVGRAIVATGLPGIYLKNPRGGWIGTHP